MVSPESGIRAVTINLGNPAAQVVNAGLTLTLTSGTTVENVIGGSLGDTITGNALNNVIEGGGGNDVLTGGAGNDIYRFDTDNALGSDTINESGGGIDTLDFSATSSRTVTVNLGLAGAQLVNAGLTLTLSSGATIENVIGGALGDTITGNALNNSLSGGAGNDTLNGGAGTDTLDGGAGTDVALNGEVLINIP
jgi:Ca2+-binding RTX toxin-like protein